MRKIFSAEQIRQWDAYTIKNEPIQSTDLMERAAHTCFTWLEKQASHYNSFIVFCGPGNNGGDGLAIARMLACAGKQVKVFLVILGKKPTPDFTINLERLKNHPEVVVQEMHENHFPVLEKNELVIDALFGSGLNKKPEGVMASVIRHINDSGCLVVSIDVPSGIPSDLSGNVDTLTAVKAGYTLTFQSPKITLLLPDYGAYAGHIIILDIGLHPEYENATPTGDYYTTREGLKDLVKERPVFGHKGLFGHALLVAGSYGKMGAAILAAKACLRGGAGLVSASIPKCGYEILQTAVPEAMVLTYDEADKFVVRFANLPKYKAIGVGPGIGTDPLTKTALHHLLMEKNLPPLVLDADAITLLAQLIAEEHLSSLPENTILTPHVGEFDRLVGAGKNSIDRHEKQLAFARKYGVYVLLKGAYTCVVTPEGTSYFNSTGNPGMATGGSGDVLTGLITALLAQSYGPLESCLLGVYLHGRAGDIATETQSQESLVASDLIEVFGKAFKELHS